MAVTLAGKVQNMKPVQNCKGFIFCTFHTVVHVYLKYLCIMKLNLFNLAFWIPLHLGILVKAFSFFLKQCNSQSACFSEARLSGTTLFSTTKQSINHDNNFECSNMHIPLTFSTSRAIFEVFDLQDI